MIRWPSFADAHQKMLEVSIEMLGGKEEFFVTVERIHWRKVRKIPDLVDGSRKVFRSGGRIIRKKPWNISNMVRRVESQNFFHVVEILASFDWVKVHNFSDTLEEK